MCASTASTRVVPRRGHVDSQHIPHGNILPVPRSRDKTRAHVLLCACALVLWYRRVPLWLASGGLPGDMVAMAVSWIEKVAWRCSSSSGNRLLLMCMISLVLLLVLSTSVTALEMERTKGGCLQVTLQVRPLWNFGCGCTAIQPRDACCAIILRDVHCTLA